MRALLPTLALLTCAGPAPAETDTPAARFTRERKLKAPITLAAEKVTLREIFRAVSDQLTDQGLSGLGVAYAEGVDPNVAVTYKGEGRPLAEALDEVLKQAGLGYVVLSERRLDRRRLDGWVEIRPGGLRGYEPGQEPPPEEPKAEKGRRPLDTAARIERIAESYLELAQAYAEIGNPELARRKVRLVIQRYPQTRAAREVAPAMLRELGEAAGEGGRP